NRRSHTRCFDGFIGPATPPEREEFFKSKIMELELIRTYYWSGTNGKILFQGRFIVYTIELPWQNNHARVSCIPEGRYELKKRWSPRFLRHLQVMNVVRRDYILFHAANDALRELKGCIAPVSSLTGAGKGLRSRTALQALTGLVYGALDQHDPVFITIKSIV
ncbi:MAG TPA: DUF5675 family protein, partial [Puia sp.]|nr:DUF5675 family protein [Puia sp.]